MLKWILENFRRTSPLFFLVHRELKEGKTTGIEPQLPPTDVVPELPAGLLGLEIPPEVRNVLKVIEIIFINNYFNPMHKKAFLYLTLRSTSYKICHS